MPRPLTLVTTLLLLLSLGAFLSLSPANPNSNNPVATVPVILTLDDPDASAPGVNNLQLTISAPLVSDSDSTVVGGTILALSRIDISDPLNPVLTGIQFTGGNFTAEDVDLTLFFFLIINVNITSTGLGGTVLTPAGVPQPVIANMFSLADHSILVNQGVFTATGFPLPEDVNIDLSTMPIAAPGVGTGNTSISYVSETPVSYTYDVGVSLPVAISQDIPIEGTALTLNVSANGSIEVSGTTTVFCLPELTTVSHTPSGIDLEIKGELGDICDLCWSDDLVNWNFLSTINLSASAITTYTDSASLSTRNRYYKLAPPSGP
ncbi:MAG: hypothetical protein AAF591_13375 [Verrucomicrobiota bacterium]